MTDTASLVVRVTEKGAGETSRKLDKLSRASGSAEASVSSLGASFGRLAGPIGAAAGVITLATTAVSAYVVASAKATKESENLARQAKLSAGEFKALAFAAGQYGVTGEQVADISKDISDKLGEFASAATGPFQDFIDVMGMTKAQGVDLAREMQNLSGDQVVGELVRRMEAAGASGNQMTFVLESLGNDLSKLIPLFSNNSAELDKLTGKYNDINKSMQLTANQSADMKELSTSFTLLSDSVGTASNSIAATLAPLMTGFFNDLIDIVPKAEQAIVNFLNRFIEVDSMNSIEAVNDEFERQREILEANQWAQDALANKTILTGRAQDQQIAALNAYNEAQAKAEELIFRRIELEDELKAKMLADASTVSAGTGTAGVSSAAVAAGSGSSKTENQKAQAQAFLQQLQQDNMSEMELIDTFEIQKQARAAEYREMGLISEQQYQDALTEIQTNAVIQRAELENKKLDEQSKLKDELRRAELARAKEEERLRDQQVRDGIDAQRNMTANLKSSLGEQSSIYKASAIATATIDTYKAATGAYSAMASIPYVGPILGAAAAGAAIVAGLANVAAIRNAREQGGWMAGGSAYQMAERGKAEVIVPAGASRARTAAQMRDIMGQNGGGGMPAVTIVNNTTGRVDNVQQERQDDGSILLTIEEFVSEQFLDPDSRISKARRATAGAAGF